MIEDILPMLYVVKMIRAPKIFQSYAFAIVTLLIAMLSIQCGASLAKELFPLVGAKGATVLRLVFAALILALIWRPWRFRLSAKEIRLIAAYGVSLGAMNLLFYLSLARIPLGVAVALEFTGPLTVAFLSSRKPVDFLWAALAVMGIFLVLPIGDSVASVDLLGALFALGAGACWACYIIFGQKAGGSSHLGAVSSLGMVAAAILVLPFGVGQLMLVTLTPKILFYALGIAILSSALPYSLEMISLKRLPAKNFGILMSLEPAFAAMSGLIFLHEQLLLSQWIAIACIILASVGSTATAKGK
jgi:inner membrane transporter RhtA